MRVPPHFLYISAKLLMQLHIPFEGDVAVCASSRSNAKDASRSNRALVPGVFLQAVYIIFYFVEFRGFADDAVALGELLWSSIPPPVLFAFASILVALRIAKSGTFL